MQFWISLSIRIWPPWCYNEMGKTMAYNSGYQEFLSEQNWDSGTSFWQLRVISSKFSHCQSISAKACCQDLVYLPKNVNMFLVTWHVAPWSWSTIMESPFDKFWVFFFVLTHFSTFLPPECSGLFPKHLIHSLIFYFTKICGWAVMLASNIFWATFRQNVTLCHSAASQPNLVEFVWQMSCCVILLPVLTQTHP
jgi:hypothetical protein